MIKSLLLVGVGSFLGGVLRYYISTLLKSCSGFQFPWGTLAVNLAGCFVFGVLFALFNRFSSTENSFYLLLTTGVCGGFTTFSAFAHESVQMLQSGNYYMFAGYLLASVIWGLLFVGLGYYVVK